MGRTGEPPPRRGWREAGSGGVAGASAVARLAAAPLVAEAGVRLGLELVEHRPLAAGAGHRGLGTRLVALLRELAEQVALGVIEAGRCLHQQGNAEIAPAGADIKRFEDNNATITAYLSGQTQLIATGNVVAAAVNERSKLRRLSTKFLIKNSPCFVGIAKGETALQAKVNEIITKAKKNGALNEISQRWLHAALPGDL